MSPADLDAFRRQMGWNRGELGRRLDISQDRLRRMLAGDVAIPAHIGLACAALAEGLAEWRPG